MVVNAIVNTVDAGNSEWVEKRRKQNHDRIGKLDVRRINTQIVLPELYVELDAEKTRESKSNLPTASVDPKKLAMSHVKGQTDLLRETVGKFSDHFKRGDAPEEWDDFSFK